MSSEFRTRGQIQWDRDRNDIERRFPRHPVPTATPRPALERLGEAEGFLIGLRARAAELDADNARIRAFIAAHYAVGSYAYREAIQNLEASAAARAREIAGAERTVAQLREEVQRAES
jgi:hypothetical protein